MNCVPPSLNPTPQRFLSGVVESESKYKKKAVESVRCFFMN